jgi:hypothetical protein
MLLLYRRGVVNRNHPWNVKGQIVEANAKAVEERYRFCSYGDCMLIL